VTSRRTSLVALGAVLASLPARGSAQAAPAVVDVRDHGARGDGVAVDTSAIRRAIDAATRTAGSVLVRFPAGEYWLGESSGEPFLPVIDAAHLVFEGAGARLRCRTRKGAPPVFYLRGAHDIAFRGLTFVDEGLERNVQSHGASAIYLSGESVRATRDIRITSCDFERMLSAVLAAGPRSRVTGITLDSMVVRHSYYGLLFQNNGDHVRGTRLRFVDCRRSYFPYGVDDHEIDFDSEANQTGSTDILIKAYSRPTTRLRIRARSTGKGRGDAIVAFEHQHVSGEGEIRDVDLRLDVTTNECRLQNVILFRSYTQGGSLEAQTRSTWAGIRVNGNVAICESGTRWMGVDSVPGRTADVRIGRDVPRHLIPAAAPPGFMLVRE